MTRDNRTRRAASIGVERLDPRISPTGFTGAFPIVPNHVPTSGPGPVVPLTGTHTRVLFAATHAFPIVPTHFPTMGPGPVVPLTGTHLRVLY